MQSNRPFEAYHVDWTNNFAIVDAHRNVRTEGEVIMVNALYYPHTAVANPNLIKTALLLWDSIECIAPARAWRERHRPDDKLLREATDIVVRQHIPTEQEMRIAHKQVDEFFRSDAVGSFAQLALREATPHRFLIYPDKFLAQTWHLLHERGVLSWDDPTSDYCVPPAIGFLIMAFLADACAGGTRQKITDRVDAYTWLEEFKARTLGAGYATGLDVSQVAPLYDRLVTLSLNVIDGRSIPLKRLVAFRKRESSSATSDYRKMRRRYVTCLDRFVDRVRKEVKTERDYDVVLRQFRADMEDDLKELKRELRLASVESLFSREMAMAICVVGGALTEPIAGLTGLALTLKGVGVAPLVATHVKLRKARREAMMSHDISWLYFSKQGKVSVT